MIDKTLDARGLKCPLPVLLAGKALKALSGGGVLEMLATDRGRRRRHGRSLRADRRGICWKPVSPRAFTVSFCERGGADAPSVYSLKF